MDKRLLYTGVAIALTLPLTTTAQTNNQNLNDLNKVVSLEREFDPVKKEVVKKTVLPQEIRKNDKDVVAPQFSDWTVPTIVPVNIPTMLPYGYRTLHNFSNQSGYLTVGAGTHLNMIANAGYKPIDNNEQKLSIWLNHSSSWLGKNSSKLIDQPSQRQKQRYNDNLLGVQWLREFDKGSLDLDGHIHFDSFNYYGGFNDYLKNNKTAFIEARADAKWVSKYNINDNDAIDYEVNATVDYAGYDKSHLEGISGAKEFWFNSSIECGYNLDRIGDVGVLFGVDVVNLRRHDIFTNAASEFFPILV